MLACSIALIGNSFVCPATGACLATAGHSVVLAHVGHARADYLCGSAIGIPKPGLSELVNEERSSVKPCPLPRTRPRARRPGSSLYRIHCRTRLSQRQHSALRFEHWPVFHGRDERKDDRLRGGPFLLMKLAGADI